MISVKEAFQKVDKNTLINALIDILPTDINKDLETNSISRWLDYVITLQEKRDENSVIIVTKNKSDLPDEKNYEYTDTSMIHIDELKKKSVELPNVTEDEIMNMNQEEVESLLPSLFFPQTFAIELCDWEEILGFSVSQTNIDKYGLANVLAGVVYEMTFFGYEREEMEEQREELHERIEEVEEIRKLSEEEQAKHFVSCEKIFEELNFVDDRTEQEKMDEHLYMYKSMLINNLRTGKVIQNIEKEIEEN